MEVFFNRQRPGYVEIVSYGPRWWTEYREMDAVYRFAGWTLDLMAYWLERLVNNQFPAMADEHAIEMFEGVLGIDPEPEATLEDRRRTVGVYYSGNSKLSESVIKQLIKSYTGCDSDLWWEGLTLHIEIMRNNDGNILLKHVIELLEDRIPAHIVLALQTARDITFDVYSGAKLTHTACYQIDYEKIGDDYNG